MIEIPGILTTILGYLRYGLDKVRDVLMWVAEAISKYAGFPADNVYNVILVVLSIWIASKIFHARNTTIQGRYLEFLITLVIIYLIIKLV